MNNYNDGKKSILKWIEFSVGVFCFMTENEKGNLIFSVFAFFVCVSNEKASFSRECITKSEWHIKKFLSVPKGQLNFMISIIRSDQMLVVIRVWNGNALETHKWQQLHPSNCPYQCVSIE